MNEIRTGVSNDSGAGVRGGTLSWVVKRRRHHYPKRSQWPSIYQSGLRHRLTICCKTQTFRLEGLHVDNLSGYDSFFRTEVQQNPGVDDANWSCFDAFRNKRFLSHGLADQNVPDRGSDYFYGQLLAHDDNNAAATQSYIRYYRYPGNQHCGGTKLQPNAPVVPQ